MRGVDLVRATLGAVLLVRPDLATTATRTPGTAGALVLTRALGLRYLLHGMVGAVAPDPLRRVGIGVEGLHAASMAPLALDHPRHARLAVAGGGVAAGLVAWEVLA